MQICNNQTPNAFMDGETQLSSKHQPFTLPVDLDGKATVFRPFSFAHPHMRAFHLAWLSLFACFFSTFSIPPLLPVIRVDLGLTDDDVSAAGIAAFVGSIFSRLAMGPACDLLGPRLASATLSLLTAPAILAGSFMRSPASFILIRFLVGFCLANFVANQFWMSSMFSGSVVGLANGVSAGWANVGSAVSQIAMPLIYSAVNSVGVPSHLAWRLVFVVPAVFQSVMAIMVLAYGQDLPSGNYTKGHSDSNKESEGKSSFVRIVMNGLLNYRGWVLGLVYGYCFGSELTTNNIIASYFYERFGLNMEVAGTIAACFGMWNLFSRPMGGVLSDKLGERWGIRGRLWGLWAVQAAAGAMCFGLGRVGSLWGSIGMMCGFSVLVEAASGLTFGIVPFVSKRSLGVISGMTGSGGTIGAVATQVVLFTGNRYATQTSISLMGVMMMAASLPVTLIYFPRHGAMFCGPSISADDQLQDHLLID